MRNSTDFCVRVLFCTGIVLLSGLNAFVFANEEDSGEDFFAMSLDKLVEQPYQIVSASRQGQSANELSVPVTVITAEDIHYSGLTNIPEILQFYVGIDVLRYSRNQYGVGVRGLHDTTSDRTLVLIDGRVCNNPAFGGMEWNKFPILLEDIKRIEVVRGPGGAAWGANAYTGVINIITKTPEETPGLFSSVTVNHFGDTLSHLRYGYSKDKLAWRISVGYLDSESSDDAGAGRFVSGNPAITSIPSVGFDTYTARDFSRNFFMDSLLKYQQTEDTTWTFGAAYANILSGDYELLAYFPRRNISTNWTRLFSRMDHDIDEHTSMHLQWYGNFYVAHEAVLSERYSTYENDFEAQINHQFNDTHSISFGGNLRFSRINVKSIDPQSAVLAGVPIHEEWVGLFVVDRYKINERLTLEGQIRGDWYSGTNRDWSARASVLYALDEQKHHTVRFSAAKAYRAPSVGFRNATISRVPVGPGVYALNVLRPVQGLKNEQTWSLEAGYIGELAHDMTLRVDTYFQQFNRLIGGEAIGFDSRLANIDDAKAYGVESELSKQFKNSTLSAWYSFNGFQTDQTNQPIRSSYPVDHKAGFRFRYRLPQDWTVNTNYAYNNHMKTYGNPLWGDIPTSHRLDLTLSKKIAENRGELMVGVSDMLNKTRDPLYSNGGFTAHETPGRTLFARVQYTF